MTRLGNAAQVRSQGRYARLPGNHWRSEAREKLTFAANGLLTDIYSYCSDQSTDEVSTTMMRRLCAPDPKNASRMLKQLVSAGFIEPTDKGWRVPDWDKMYPTAKVSHLRVVDGGADEAGQADEGGLKGSSEEAETRAETRAETLAQRSAPPENIEESGPLFNTQIPDPRVKKEEADKPPRSPAEPEAEPEAQPAPPERSTKQRIAELEDAYGAPTTLAECREGIALSRRGGKVSDLVWLRTLEQLAKHSPAVALDAMRQFTEKHADGDKREEYLLGIARGTTRRLAAGQRLRRVVPERRGPSAQEQAESDAFERFLLGGRVAS